MMINTHFIIPEKELVDITRLASILKYDGWLKMNTIIVNCSPEYSSIMTQILNHKLSNKELFEQIELELPQPNMSQVWDKISLRYEMFDRYLVNWAEKYVDRTSRYLFVDTGINKCKNFSKIKAYIKRKLEPDEYRFCSLYVEESQLFVPDYYVEKYQGDLAFYWQNLNNLSNDKRRESQSIS